MNCDIHHPARSMFNSAIQTKSMKTDNVILSIMTVPEPQTWLMLGGGLALLGLLQRRKVS